MEADGKYSMDFLHGVEQARPVVDLNDRVTWIENRVQWIENRVKILSLMAAFATSFVITFFVTTYILETNKHFIKKLKWKRDKKTNDEENEIRENRKEAVATKNFRRHARDFDIVELTELD